MFTNLALILRIIFFGFLFFRFLDMKAQVANTGLMDTLSGLKIDHLSIGAYVDTYIGYSTASQNRNVSYFVSSNKSKEFNINLAYIAIRYSDQNFRARFAPAVGTYMNANYQSEPGTLRNILEASAGFKVFNRKDIWIDAGVIGSPYTNESAISKDHLMYTRSLAPEYVPYYLSGIKISIPVSKKINLYMYLINGWQQIQEVNNGKAVGSQVEYRPNSKNLFNWNTYLGDERSDQAPQNRMRYFTDVYWIHNPEGQFSFTSCVYVGNQKRISTPSDRNNYWWQANVIGNYKFTPNWSVSSRLEYFSDPNNIQIASLTTKVPGTSLYSTGICINYKIRDKALLRFEGRYFSSGKKIFYNEEENPKKHMLWLVSNMTVWF